jgi:hypothetical protein
MFTPPGGSGYVDHLVIGVIIVSGDLDLLDIEYRGDSKKAISAAMTPTTIRNLSR